MPVSNAFRQRGVICFPHATGGFLPVVISPSQVHARPVAGKAEPQSTVSSAPCGSKTPNGETLIDLDTYQSSILSAVHSLLHNHRKLVMQIGSVNKNRRRQSISMRIRVTFILAVNC
jgi:hypothetical protein